METLKYYQRIKINFREEMLLLVDFILPRFTIAYIIIDLFHGIGLQP